MPVKASGAHGANVMKANLRQKRLAEQQQAEEAKIAEFFAKFDVARDGKFSRDEFKNVLTEVKREALEDTAAVVRDEMLEKIYAKYDLNHDGQMERTEVLKAIKQYKALLKNEGKLQALFDKHDTDTSGVLPAGQLLSLLQEVALEVHVKNEALEDRVRRARAVSQPDVDFVLSTSDKDGDKAISFEELGPAVAAWREAAATIEHDAPAKSSACVLL